MKKNNNSKRFIIGAVIALCLVIVLVAIMLIGKEGETATPSISPSSGEAIPAESEQSVPISLEGNSIEQSYEDYLNGYLELNESILDVVAEETLGNPNPFYKKLERILQNKELRNLLRIMGSELKYSVVKAGYANNTDTAYLVEMAVNYPDMGKALHYNSADRDLSVAYLTDKEVAEFIKDSDIDELERNNGYLLAFFEKHEDGKWYLVSVSDAQSNSMKLTEFGGVTLYSYDESKKDFPIFLQLDSSKKVTVKAFTDDFHWNDSVINCIDDVLSGINEQKSELVFTDNSGVFDKDNLSFYLEDTAIGAELYREYQTMEVDETVSDNAKLYLDYADVNVNYYMIESDVSKGYIVDFDYSYVNKIYATRLLYAKTGKQFSNLSVEEHREFIEDNKETLIITEQKTCNWWDNEEIDPGRMLVNTLCEIVSDCTFGG